MRFYISLLLLFIFACDDGSNSEIISKWPNGQVKVIREYQREVDVGGPNYKETAFHENSAIKSSGQFLDRKKSGAWMNWYSSGEIKIASHYLNGHLTGVHTTYFKNGKIKEKCGYKRESLNGKYVEYDSLMEVISVGNYVDGKREGLWFETSNPKFSIEASNYSSEGNELFYIRHWQIRSR